MRKTPAETIFNYEKTLAQQKWEAVSDFFHEDCVVVFAEATYFGKKQVGMAIDKTFSLIKDEDFILSDIQWIYESDSFATCIFNYKWAGTLNGKRFNSSGRGTLAMILSDGQWQVVTEHLGPLPL